MYHLRWLLIGLLFSCHPAYAGDEAPASGEELLSHCRIYTQLSPMPWGFKVTDTNPSVAVCLSFMSGLIGQPGAVKDKADVGYCLPADIAPGQLASVFVAYADISPQIHEQTADQAASELFKQAFPCK